MLAHFGGSASAVRAHEELFAYWASRRDHGRLPGRRQIDPTDFKRHLPTISLIDVHTSAGGEAACPRDYRLRLAGTGLFGVYGREITGLSLDKVYDAESAAYWREHLDTVVEERRPAVGFHSMAWRGAPHLSLLWLRLPLAGNGRDVDMILGYDVLVGVNSNEERPTGIRAA
ncbi:MAG: motility/cell cycle regulatory protein MopJ [Caulobacteraceae bacterium]